MALLAPQRFPMPLQPEAANLYTFFDMVSSEDKVLQYDGLVGIRKLLSIEVNPPIQQVIDSGYVPKLLEFLKWDDEPKFQFESAWIVTNICSGTSQHVAYMVENGSLELVSHLLGSNTTDVVDQAVWTIGNIAGDSVYYRNICLDQGFMGKFIATVLKFDSNLSIVKNAVWGISNLCRGKPSPAFEQVCAAVPFLTQILSRYTDMDVLTDALWGLSYLSEIAAPQIISLGCVPILVSHLTSTLPAIITPALRALGNIVTGDDFQTNAVLTCPGFLASIFNLTSHPKKNIKKESFWTLSNIAAGNAQQIQLILDVPEYLKILKEGLNASIDISTEVAWCWTNFLSNATVEQVGLLVKQYEYLTCLSVTLANPKSKVKLQVLDAALRILNKMKDTPELGDYIKLFKEEGLHKSIFKMNYSPDLAKHVDDIKEFFKTSGGDNESSDNEETTKEKKKKNADSEESDEEDEEEEEEVEESEDEEEDGDDEENESEKEDGEENPYQNPVRED